MSYSYLAPARAPQQLDIIADTILRGDDETPGASSTAGRAKVPGASSTARKGKMPGASSTARKGKMPGASSTATFKQVEARRRKAGISIPRLCAAAGVHPRTYERAGHAPMRAGTLKKFNDALDAADTGVAATEQRAFHQSYLRRLTRDLARQSGWDPELMLNQDFSAENTNDPVWLQASRLRRCAIYLLVEGLLDGKRAPMARAIGITRQAVHKGVAAIEAERMRDITFDAWMQKAMDEVKADR